MRTLIKIALLASLCSSLFGVSLYEAAQHPYLHLWYENIPVPVETEGLKKATLTRKSDEETGEFEVIKTVLEYDNGKAVKRSDLSKDGKLLRMELYSYDDKGRLLNKVSESGSKKFFFKYDYSEKGKVTIMRSGTEKNFSPVGFIYIEENGVVNRIVENVIPQWGRVMYFNTKDIDGDILLNSVKTSYFDMRKGSEININYIYFDDVFESGQIFYDYKDGRLVESDDINKTISIEYDGDELQALIIKTGDKEKRIAVKKDGNGRPTLFGTVKISYE